MKNIFSRESGSRAGSYHWIHRRWPPTARKAIKWLMPLELIGLVPVLVIFGISQPDLYRSDLWRIGYENGLNSNPAMILFAYANHEPIPTVPLVWSRTLTDLNVAMSIISLFFLLVKLITFIMRTWYPVASAFSSLSLVALYTVSVYGQIGPDHADPERPAAVAWYLTHGCDLARPWGKYSSCQIAQASLFLSLYMLVIYLLNLGFSIWALWPDKINDIEVDDDDDYVPQKQETDIVEMQGMMGAMPFTPRTQAFHTLNRDLPLRSQQYRTV
jgi:hypothetical protein